eukprot:GDKI01000290.1.p1 GENE.GDKI01000290.1~~GDKI01000290.1.p1  ORF type:complete len:222 (-),score=9.71 GDKI01000290.1:171-836(-)
MGICSLGSRQIAFNSCCTVGYSCFVNREQPCLQKQPPQSLFVTHLYQCKMSFIARAVNNMFTIKFAAKALSAIMWGAGAYAFANPDQDTVYEMFPVFRQRNYAFLTPYKVKDEDKQEFEDRWKDLARFFQQQEGYLFTKLLRSKEPNAQYPYIAVTTWVTADSHKRATDKPVFKRLVDNLPTEAYRSVLYKIVVDDSEYVPSTGAGVAPPSAVAQAQTVKR